MRKGFSYALQVMLGSCSLIPVLTNAQTASPTLQADTDNPTSETEPEENADSDQGVIVVTGSRVARQGFQQPTPTTVLGEELLTARAPATLAEAVTLLPQLAGSPNPRTVNNSTFGGTAGANLLNLRGLGVSRTLVLLDGHRVVPSTTTGAVDINLFPSNLVRRAEVVTGGASAAYGSDAVAGVVNFILDDRFSGLKGSIQTGITQEGDGASYRGDLAYGGSFADDKLHILVSGVYEKQEGAGPASSRDWYEGKKFVTNPAYIAGNGQPQFAILPGIVSGLASAGGVITSGPLRGTQFLPGGVPAPFNFGFLSGVSSVGGSGPDDGAFNQLQAPLKNINLYGRAAYDVTDDVQGYIELQYGRSTTNYYTVPYFRFNNITIRDSNAYLDGATLARMNAAGVTSFTLGRTNRDLGVVQGYNKRELQRYVGGLKGALGNFEWDVYYQRGRSDILNRLDNDAITANYNNAVDAVRNANGEIVCRSTLANPSNNCSPLNVFGDGSASVAAAAYINGTAIQNITITQDVASASFSGEPLSLPAGPISIAAGAEYRHEDYDATADPISLANGFFVGNYKPSSGDIGVKEAFVEVVVPLLRDLPVIETLEFNGAARVTDYTTSGTVGTWKLGLTWDIGAGLRLRGTRSRDIRAPNLNDLYQGGQSGTGTILDPRTRDSYFVQTLLVGNTDLNPETANTYTVGAIYNPTWLPGLNASIDYFNIKIDDSIVTLSAQTFVDNCAAGDQSFCQFIDRNAAGVITRVTTPGLNASSEATSGIDFELNYRSRIGSSGAAAPGTLAVSLFGTWIDKRTLLAGPIERDYAGTLSDSTAVPRWRGLATVTYSVADFSTTLTGRYIGEGILSDRFVDNGIIGNDIPATFYLDFAASQGVSVGSKSVEVFLAIDNLLNQDPRAAARTTGNTNTDTGTNPSIYDVLGRAFRVGARFAF